MTSSCSYVTVSQSPASKPYPLVLERDKKGRQVTSACLVPSHMHGTGLELGHRQVCLSFSTQGWEHP